MSKLYENCQRMVLATYANEMADTCQTLGIDPWEVSKAASTKPYGFLPFLPGAGVGGHCIPINPYYLLSTCSMPLLEQATQTTQQRPSRLAGRMVAALTAKSKAEHPVSPSDRKARLRILVVGVGFKRGQSVLSNSPGIAIIVALLEEWDAYVEFADPLVSEQALHYVPRFDDSADWRPDCLQRFNGIIIAMNQVGLDMSILASLEDVIVHDYCNVVRDEQLLG